MAWAGNAYDTAHHINESGSHLTEPILRASGEFHRDCIAKYIANLMVNIMEEPGPDFEPDEEDTDTEPSSEEDNSEEAWRRRATRRSWTPPPEDAETEDTE